MAEGNHQSDAQELPAKKTKSHGANNEPSGNKRRCVSTACIACRKRKSKCDGNTPSCAACASVYQTECVYDPNSDHRRKGVYKEKIDSLKTRNSTLQILIQAILNAAEDDVADLVHQIRSCESLDAVAEAIVKQENGIKDEGYEDGLVVGQTRLPTFETQLSGKMGELRLENGSVRFLGGTSNLIYLPPTLDVVTNSTELYHLQAEEPLTSWSTVTKDRELIVLLINLYFTYHFPFFTTLSKSLFYRDFLHGKPSDEKRLPYCSSLLVNAMLALGCHFTSSPRACADPDDPATKGDAFFAEAKRLIVENDEYEKPRLTTVQALALMSVREAGCGREQKGWVYSGMSFRMAQDLGLNLDSGGITASKETMDEKEIDARRITFWGCFLFDKCWSNYLGRLPQLPISNITVSKYDVFPDEEADLWSPYTDNGVSQPHSQPSRTRAIALQISSLCEISSDLLMFFYHPQHLEKPVGKATEIKKLGELHTRLETWRRDLPKEFEAKEGQLPNVLLMHMFFHLLYIHLFRPFLKYDPQTSPLPAHVSPRKWCTQAASSISKIMRCYKRTYGLRQICNIAVYFLHSACTIHLLTLPDKTAKRDIVHGLKNLEEIAEDWLCARRTLSMLSVLARKWKVELPEEASTVLARTDVRFGFFSTADVPESRSRSGSPQTTHQQRNGKRTFPGALHPSSMSNGFPTPAGSTGVTSAPSQQAEAPFFTSQSSSLNYMVLSPDSTMSNNTSTPPPTTSRTVEQPQPPTMAIQRPPQQAISITAETSPSVMFGGGVGVEGFVESQDWWLGDQSSLAVGFDNWNGIDASLMGDMITDSNEGFTMDGIGSGLGNGELGNEDWYT